MPGNTGHTNLVLLMDLQGGFGVQTVTEQITLLLPLLSFGSLTSLRSSSNSLNPAQW